MISLRSIRSWAVLALASGALTGAVLSPNAAAAAVGPDPLGPLGANPAAAARPPVPPRGADYVPGEVVVGYLPSAGPTLTADIARSMRFRAAPSLGGGAHVLRLPRGMSVTRALTALRRQPGIAYAVPNFIAHIAAARIPGWIPNDPGIAHVRAGWEALQWNFLPGTGVDAPQAWSHLRADRRPGGRGVLVAVLDTGVAYRKWHNYAKSPDFAGTRFVSPYDFVANNPYPLDRDGHGTTVAGVIGEATNNGAGVTGLAYGASIMPVRVLGADGSGDAGTISKGIRYAVTHGARVINLSLEFSMDVTPGDIPDVLSAIEFAHARGVVVVAAAGNEGTAQLAYPARAPAVISVGASTRDRCLAAYSNMGPTLDLVAPGGGDDAALSSDPNCHPLRQLPTIYQMTFLSAAHPRLFALPGGISGTSFAAPHVAATAALIIASGVLGKRPTPDQILGRLEATAQPLGGSQPNPDYGYGLLNAAAATARDRGTG
ncbi:MAG: S8 family serine peptidase [Solirubrobacteraceae bacterium]